MPLIIYMLCVLGIMVVIFYLSSQPAEQSDQLSMSFTAALLEVFLQNDLNESEHTVLIINYNEIVRNAAHFFIFSFLGLFMHLLLLSKKFKKPILFSIIIGLIYAISDEFHQIFVPGRGAQIQDVLLDFSGVIGGVSVITIFNLLRRNNFT